MTMTSIVTHGYSPIEQYQTKGRMGPWTDMYAMGAVMCRAMTGEKPPVAADRLMDDDFTWLSYQKLTGFSDGFRQAIDWSLRVRPEERPQSVGQWMGFLDGGGAMHNRVSATTSQQRANTAVSVPTIAGVSQGTPAATEHRAASRRGKILAIVAVCFLLVATVLGFAVSGFVGLLESRNAAESTSKGAVALPGASVAIPNTAVPTQQSAATDDQNGSGAPVGDAQGEPVEPPAVSSSSAGPSPQPMRAMLIGDSFSVGAFGQRIGDLLMQQFGREQVCIFASCGSSPEDWVEGGFITDCGYRQTTPADSLIYGDGTAPNRPVKTPSLGKLLELYRPEFVIVQLGTNWMDKLSGPDHPGETYYRNLIDSFVQEIRKQNPAAKIFWILPPSSTKYASRIHEEVEKWINEASRSLGFFTINSRSVMGPFRGGAGGGDGVHMADSAAQSWAAGAYTKFARATKILGVGSSPGGTSPSSVDAVLGNPPSSGELQIFSAGIDALFPAGYAVYDDTGKFLKRVDGPVSAHLKGQTSGKAFIRGAAYLSDWSYQRMQEGHSPNWMAGDPQIDSSRGSNFSGGEDKSVAQSSTGTQANQNGATPAAEVLGIPPAGQLQIFGANVEVFFPQGYTVFDDNGRFLKRVNGPVSAAVRGQTSGKPFARGILYLSDWSFERMQQDHSPNWISGEAFVPSQGNSEGGC
ncbi:MAG: hypothetical protein JHC85_08485, partial [Chthoniobacterales bacterium]|nr:hypothetical protein [Chthoniobacterales bacterium]